MVRGLLVAGALGALSGCGPAGPAVYPVSGVVVFPDGAPVKSGTIEFEPAGFPIAGSKQGDPDALGCKRGNGKADTALRHRRPVPCRAARARHVR